MEPFGTLQAGTLQMIEPLTDLDTQLRPIPIADAPVSDTPHAEKDKTEKKAHKEKKAKRNKSEKKEKKHIKEKNVKDEKQYTKGTNAATKTRKRPVPVDFGRLRVSPVAGAWIEDQLNQWQAANNRGPLSPPSREWMTETRATCIAEGHILRLSCDDVVRNRIRTVVYKQGELRLGVYMTADCLCLLVYNTPLCMNAASIVSGVK